MRAGRSSNSTFENVLFGTALVLFLIVGYFIAKRFGLISGFSALPAPATAPTESGPDQPFRVGVDDKSDRPLLVGHDAGPDVSDVPPLKGSRFKRVARKTVVPSPD